MAYCEYCERYFGSTQALWQHIDNSSIHECSVCDYHFCDSDDQDQHLEEAHEYCGDCCEWVANPRRLHTHNLSSHGERYCADCRRLFIGASQYNSHRNSSVHLAKDIACPYRSRGCNKSFINTVAMAKHLESGTCVSGMTRADVNQRAIAADRNRVIVDPSRMIGNGTVSYSVTDRAWNGYAAAWECYLCHATFPGDRGRVALNQHLNSPRHEDKIYVCPCTTCSMRFSTLSGFMEHVESNRCGVKRFRIVQDAMAQLTNGMRRLTY